MSGRHKQMRVHPKVKPPQITEDQFLEGYLKVRHLMKTQPLDFMEGLASYIENWDGKLPRGCFDPHMPEIISFVREHRSLISNFWKNRQKH